jgi:5-methylcytosine-specific restriction protein A
MEVHHIDRLSDGGPDHSAYFAALFPDGHANIHRGRDGDKCNAYLRNYITSVETQSQLASTCA